MQLHETTAESQQAKQCKFTWRGQWEHSSATTIICQWHKESSLSYSSGKIKSAERQSKWRKLKWRVNESMQGKDVQAASETNVFTGTWLPLLRIPFSADHSMHIKKNTFWGARTLAGPNPVHKRRKKPMFKMTLPWKGASLIWKGVPRVFNNFHKFPQTNVLPLHV